MTEGLPASAGDTGLILGHGLGISEMPKST